MELGNIPKRVSPANTISLSIKILAEPGECPGVHSTLASKPYLLRSTESVNTMSASQGLYLNHVENRSATWLIMNRVSLFVPRGRGDDPENKQENSS